jgi:hypothetical protein
MVIVVVTMMVTWLGEGRSRKRQYQAEQKKLFHERNLTKSNLRKRM